MVQHFLVVLLPVAVPADAGEVLREVLPFSEKPHLVAAQLRHINREGVRRHPEDTPVDRGVKRVSCETRGPVISNVVSEIETTRLRAEIRVFLLSVGSADIAVALVAAIQPIVETVRGARNRRAFA